MTAQTMMNANPVVLHPTDTVGTAARHIISHHLRRLPVVDEEGRYPRQRSEQPVFCWRLVGMISSWDALQQIAGEEDV